MRSTAEFADFLQSVREYRREPITREVFLRLVEAWGDSPLEPGDLVAVAWPSGQTFLAQVLAVLSVGLVPMPVHPAIPTCQFQSLIQDCGVKAVTQGKIAAALSSLGEVRSLPLGQCLLLNQTTPQPEDLSAGDFVLSTSGTSGHSSGCVFDFEALLTNANRHRRVVGLQASDSVLVALPLYYSYAFVAQALAAMHAGSALRILASPVTARAMFDAIASSSATTTSLTPTLARAILNEQPGLLGAFRMVTVGGDATGHRDVERMLLAHPELELFLTYGLTEAGPRVSTLAVRKEPTRRWTSVGTPLPETTTALLAPDPATGIGELTVSSSTLMRSRIGRPASEFHKTWASESVLRTGDLFRIDEDGYLYFQSRSNRFVVRHGEKVSLATVRQAALSLPGVNAARIEASHPDGLRLLVWVGDDVDAKSLRRHLLAGLRHAERPDHVQFESSPLPLK